MMVLFVSPLVNTYCVDLVDQQLDLRLNMLQSVVEASRNCSMVSDGTNARDCKNFQSDYRNLIGIPTRFIPSSIHPLIKTSS